VVPAATAVPSPSQRRLRGLHTPQEQLDVLRAIEPAFEREILPLLKSPDTLWQPADLLPDASDADRFYDEVRDLRLRAAELPDDVLVVLVGDMVTEEALPTYMAQLNTLDGIRDETGASPSPYARWTREWTAEENRHGDLLNKYLYLTGRVDMRAVEGTIQRLIGSGMDIKTNHHPYRCLIYTSFQERATKMSHGATARLAAAAGDTVLTKIAGLIAADEARHEAAYTRTMDLIFEADPDGAVACFADMMRNQITMPAHFMDDGIHNTGGRSLFQDFSSIAENLGVYSSEDYISIMEHLIERWDVSHLRLKSAEDQDYLMSLPSRYRRLAERRSSKRGPREAVSFSWIGDRNVNL
jgi:acyl-[acyl-carrier-protein] desaturase